MARQRRRYDDDYEDDYDDDYDREEEGDATGGVIPYKNVPALIAYYCGVFSLIPILGLVLGLIAIILGILGFAKYRKNPRVRGVVHALIGIVLGSLTFLGNLTLILLVLAGSFASGR